MSRSWVAIDLGICIEDRNFDAEIFCKEDSEQKTGGTSSDNNDLVVLATGETLT